MAKAGDKAPPPCAPRKPEVSGARTRGSLSAATAPGTAVVSEATAPSGGASRGGARPAGAGRGRPILARAGPALSRELSRRRPSPCAAAAEPIKFVSDKSKKRGVKERCRRVARGCWRVRGCPPARSAQPGAAAAGEDRRAAPAPAPAALGLGSCHRPRAAAPPPLSGPACEYGGAAETGSAPRRGRAVLRGLAVTPGSAGASGESDRCQAPPPPGAARAGGTSAALAAGRVALWDGELLRVLLRGAAGGGPRPGEGRAPPDNCLEPASPLCSASSLPLGLRNM